MPPKIITMLGSLTTAELTLTKRGANNRRFAMTKGGIPMDPEVFAALMSTPAEGEDTFLTTLKSQGVTDQEKIDAAVASYRVQKGMKDLVDDETMAAVTKSVGYTAKAVTPNEGKDDKKPDATSGEVDPKAKQKNKMGKAAPLDLSTLDEATRAQVDAVFKSHSDLAEKSAEMATVMKSLISEVGDLKDERSEISFVAKAAKDFEHIPMPDKELGLMLKSAHGVSPEFAKGFEGMLGKLDSMVQKSGMLTTAGAVYKAAEGGAWAKIEALANGMVQKSAEGGNQISFQKAADLVMKSHPDLYREYLGDNPKQRAEIY